MKYPRIQLYTACKMKREIRPFSKFIEELSVFISGYCTKSMLEIKHFLRDSVLEII